MRSVVVLASLLALLRPCSRAATPIAAARSVTPAPLVVAPPPDPVRVETLHLAGDLDAYAVRGAKEHRLHMLFIPGMCVHPVGYVQAFQFAAAARGDLVTLQGDVSCGGDGAARRWSSDLAAMDRRIDAAFAAAGVAPTDIVVIGYSQGAERAEHLVARWPAKYTRAVLLASPIVPSPARLGKSRGVALMAGTYDMALGPMRSAVPSLRRAKVPATFIELPGARHGAMGEEPEKTMKAAFDFLEES